MTVVEYVHERRYVFSALAFFILFLVSAVTLASPDWRTGKYGSQEEVRTGLLTRCYHDTVQGVNKCSPFMLASQAEWFEVSRIFCCVAVVLLFTLVIASAFLHFVDRKRQDFPFVVGGSIFTAALGITGSIVFAVRSDSLLDSANLDWGFAVYLTTQALVAIGPLALYYFLKVKRHRSKLRPIAPERDIIRF